MAVDELSVALNNSTIVASTPSSIAIQNNEVGKLLQRVQAVESGIFQRNEAVDESTRRARRAVESLKCYSAQWKWCPANYYNTELAQRAKHLGTFSQNQLCKAMLMENRAYDSKHARGKNDRTYSRFYLVVVQYTAEFNSRKLEVAIRSLRSMKEGRLTPNCFKFLVAKEEDNLRLTGYAHNSVSPFGILDTTIPIVLPSAVVDELQSSSPIFWMGGGHVHLKLGMAINDFIRATNAIVADVTDPR
eukprot:CAMPEP_0195519482 /NCGR_PEP_ID=MMETSP0794_2-20130614/14862_1 /TAXON_ID=515487 /ORGANISM="Stephanopyxis turris, Strain CCMP 815" /LENGTH=245 /DNA_ID=CAMNT_0040648641 /DNA_START=123 /DNA_END=860 /DNA_ORIENTATION=+